jgi:hypothetical protein
MLEAILNKHKLKRNSGNEKATISGEDKPTGLFLNEEKCFDQKEKVDEVMKRYCTLYNENQEDNYSIKPMNYEFLQKKQRKIDNSSNAGKGWFNLPAPEITPELKQDLKAIQLRSVIDPSRFYKKLDRKKLPKYFQIGTIQDNIIDGKNSRVKKSEVKDRILEEFLEQDKVVNFSKRKFDEIQNQKRKISMKKQKINKYKVQNRGNKRKTDFIVKN